MDKKFCLLLFSLALLCGCAQKVLLEYPLALSAKRNDLPADAGSTNVIVYANTDWTISLSECDWASIDKTSGSGLGSFVFRFDENPGPARKALVTVREGDRIATIEMVQKSSFGEMTLRFIQTSLTLSRAGGESVLPLESNIPPAQLKDILISVKGQQGEQVDWISDVIIAQGSVLKYKLDENTLGTDRKAVISLAYTDDFGTETRTNLTLTQTSQMPSISWDSSLLGKAFPAEASTISLSFSTNLLPFVPQLLASAKSSASWARIVTNDPYSTVFDVVLKANNRGADRVARIELTFTSSEGTKYPFSFILVQAATSSLSN